MKLTALATLLLLASLSSVCLAGDFFQESYPTESSITCPNKKSALYFGLIMSFDAEQFDGSGAIAGVKVALDRINGNCSLLPDYSLHYTVANSRCTRTGGLDALFENTLFSTPSPKIAVIGSGCSPATEPTAEVSHYHNITHISCVSSSPALTNRARFRNYFQLLNSEDTLAYAYYEMIRQYSWRHVSLIVQDENIFTSMIDVLEGLLTNDGITFDQRLFSSQSGIAALGDQPFAHARGVHLPQHVLLTPAWYNANWWRVNDNLTCTVEQREFVLNSSLAFLHFNFLERNETNNVTTSDPDGLTDSEYFEQEAGFIGTLPLNLTESPYAPYCYDATWALFYALQSTVQDLQDPLINQNLSEAYALGPSEPFTLTNFSYSNDALGRIIFNHLTNTDFSGTTGRVHFNSEGVREVTKLIIYQFRANSSGLINWVEIGQVTGQVTDNGANFTFSGESNEMVWPGGIPSDGIPINTTATIHPAVTTVYFILTTVGIAFTGVCLVFNFVFREKKLIKLTSPNLNLLIGVGAFILYFNLYLFIFPVSDPSTVEVLCNLTPWLTAIGYSLCYGTIVAKMTRVYYIFNNPTPKKAKVSDWKLFLGVLALVVIDVIILTVYTAVEGSTVYPDGLTGLQARRVVNREFPTDEVNGIVTNYFVYVCNAPSRDIMLAVLYGYKALLQVIALVFSFSIRKVKVKGLGDAIYIAVSIYVSSIVLAVILVSTFTLMVFVNIFPVVFCTGFLIGTTVILGLVFIPLMVGLYKDPEGETVFDKTNRSMTTMNNNLHTQTMDGLRKRVTELEAIVASTQMGTSMNGVYRMTEIGDSPAAPSIPDQPPVMTPCEELQGVLHKMAGEPPRKRTNTIWDEEEEKKSVAAAETGNGDTVGNGDPRDTFSE